MSILNSVMREEYNRLNRIIDKIEYEIAELPKGYISKKTINDKVYFYLQFKECGKVKSVYIKKEDVETYRSMIERRKGLLLKLEELQADKKKLEKVLK